MEQLEKERSHVDGQSSQITAPLKDLDIIKPFPEKNVLILPRKLTLVQTWLEKMTSNYALAQARILAYALKLCLFPINLTFDYDFPVNWKSQTFSNFIPVIIWLVLILVIFKNRRGIFPMVIFAVSWFLITLSPTNSFLPRADLLSERNLYLASFGLTFLIAYVFHHLFFRKPESSLSKQGMALLMTFF